MRPGRLRSFAAVDLYDGAPGCAGAANQPGARADAVTAAYGRLYTYDRNGNQIRAQAGSPAASRAIAYTAEDQVREIVQGSRITRFTYGPDGSRWRREDIGDPGGNRITLYLGGVERISQGATLTWRRHVGGVAVVNVSGATETVRWLFQDHLGSIDAVTHDYNNPLNGTDPSGYSLVATWIRAIVAIIAIAATGGAAAGLIATEFASAMVTVAWGGDYGRRRQWRSPGAFSALLFFGVGSCFQSTHAASMGFRNAQGLTTSGRIVNVLDQPMEMLFHKYIGNSMKSVPLFFLVAANLAPVGCAASSKLVICTRGGAVAVFNAGVGCSSATDRDFMNANIDLSDPVLPAAIRAAGDVMNDLAYGPADAETSSYLGADAYEALKIRGLSAVIEVVPDMHDTLGPDTYRVSFDINLGGRERVQLLIEARTKRSEWILLVD